MTVYLAIYIEIDGCMMEKARVFSTRKEAEDFAAETAGEVYAATLDSRRQARMLDGPLTRKARAYLRKLRK